ncbi:MAG: hypothetical protein HC872_01185 [Gammaproteobacteria bacterium]|nr:hypothetical protein [Gammaproteobacteria bacterium]
MLRQICFLLTGTLALWFASSEQVSRASTAAAADCSARALQSEEILPLLPQARRQQFAEIPLEVTVAELDGAAPQEMVAFADDVDNVWKWRHAETEEEWNAPRPDAESVLWVFGCKPQGWQLLGERVYRLDDAQHSDSETEGAPGFKVVKAERLLPDRDLLRVEWLDLRDGHSPFFTYRAFDLYALRNDELSRVFICSTLYEYRSGPARFGRHTQRTIQFLKDKLPARVRVAMRSAWDPGVEPADPADRPAGWDEPSDDKPASESRTATYRYDGTAFVAEIPVCDEGREANAGRRKLLREKHVFIHWRRSTGRGGATLARFVRVPRTLVRVNQTLRLPLKAADILRSDILLKTLKWLALTSLLLIFLFGATLGLVMWHFYPSPPDLPGSKAASALDAQRQDLAYFQQLLKLDRAFTPATRAQALQRIAELAAQPAVLDRPHFRVALMQIMAFADNGHTRLGYDPATAPRTLPVRVALFSDGAYVMRAKGAAVDLLGGRIVAIDGMPMETVLARLETLRGGPRQWRRAYACDYLLLQDLLHGLDISAHADQSAWSVVTPEGINITRTLEAYAAPADQPDPFVKRWLSSEPLAGLDKAWQAYQPESLPMSLQDYDTPFRTSLLADGCTRYVQYKSNDDENGQSIRDFSAKLADKMRAQPPCALIMDLRHNDGGNYVKTAHFMRHVVEYTAPDAPVYLLTGHFTYSAGLVSTAFIKHTGGDRVTVLGAETGDRIQFFAEGGRGCLPNYPLCVGYATGKHDYGKACWNLRQCFWVNYLFPTRVASLAPDETIELSFEDWRRGRDPVYERAWQLARQRAARSQPPPQ